MTTKTYDTVDDLPDLSGGKQISSVDELPDLKKKESPSNRGLAALSVAGAALQTGTESTPPSTSQSPLDIKGIFEFNKGRKKEPLKAQSGDVDINNIANGVYMGNIEADELSNAYGNVFSKPIIESVINQYAPDLGGHGWDKEVFRNEEKWDELSKRIKTKNRINAKVGKEAYMGEVDQEIYNAVTNFKTVNARVSGGTGGAAVSISEAPLPVIDINNPLEYGKVIEQLKSSDKVVDKDGNEVVGAKQRLIAALDEKAKSITAEQGVDPEVSSMDDKVASAIARSNINREIGENISTDEFAKNDKQNAEHFKLGLSYLKKVQPGQYKNVVRVIDEGKQVPDDDFRNIAEVGQEIQNEQVFFGAAQNPELIDKETFLDYTTRSDKKAQYAAVIGERLKAAGGTNRREFTEAEIKKAAFDLPNKSVVQELANEEKIPGYDAIPKSGAIESVVQGIMQPFDGIRSTFELMSESPAETYIRSKRLDTGSSQKVLDAEGNVSGVLPSDRGNVFYDMMRGLGQFIPQVLLTKGIGGGVAGVVSADARLALTPALRSGVSTYGGTAISTFMQTYGDSYADYLQKTGDHATARLGATVDAGSASAFELILPDVKIADKALSGFKSLSNDIIDLVKKGGDPATLAKKARPFIQKAVTNTINVIGQEVAEEDGTQLVDYITESIFSPQTAKDRDLGKELLETTKATAISMAIPALLGGAGSSVNQDFTKSAFTSAAINFDDYRQALDKQLNNDAISQLEYNDAIKLLSTHRESINAAPKQNINGLEIDGQKQLDYAYEDTKIKVYKEKAAASDGVAKEMWESKIKQSEDIQREILMPKVVETVAPVVEETVAVDETIRTPEQIETELSTSLGEETSNTIRGQVQELVDNDLIPADDKQFAQDNPIQFMQTVAEQARSQTTTPAGEVVTAREGTINKYGESVVAAAEDFFPAPTQEPQASIQAEGAGESSPFALDEKRATDKKPTFDEISTVFGIEEKDVDNPFWKPTEKPAKDVMDWVENSEYSLPHEKELLKKYKEIIDPNLKIIFDTNMPPNRSGGSVYYKGKLESIQINPKATTLKGSTANFGNTVIHEVTHALTYDQNGNMKKGLVDNLAPLFDVAEEYINKNINSLKEKYKSEHKITYGLSGINEFAAEAMSNRQFQEILASIPYKGTTKSVWAKVIDGIKDYFSKILGTSNETLLDEVVNNIINSIDATISQPNTTQNEIQQPATSAQPTAVNEPTNETNVTASQARNTPATPTQPVQSRPKKETVKSLTDELRSLLGNEAAALTGDANPKNRISFTDLGITASDTIEQAIDKLITYGGDFTNIFKAIKADANFKNVKLQLVDSRSGLENGESGLYYPVGYGEGMDNTLQIANKDNVYYTAAHELLHFLTLDGATANELKNTPSYQALTDMYNYVADKKGKPVAIAGGATIENYGLTNEKEFMAELLINPTFRNYVSDVFAENKDDIFKTSKSIRDSKVNSIGDIIFNFFKDIYNKLFSSPATDIPFDEKQSVVDNAAKLATQLFFGGENVIVGQTDSGEGGTVLGMGSTDLRTAALALPGTNRNEQINTFVKSALNRGVNEADLKQALVNNGISEADAQGYIDSNKAAPAYPAQPKSSTRSDNEIISTVLTQRLDAKTFPTLFSGNEEQQQIAANTQGVAQNREVDGAYIVATEKDLKEISVQSAKLLRDELGKDWGVKTLEWIEKNPSQGNIAQVVGVLNVISTENFQDIQDTHDGNRVKKLAAIQKRIDVVSIQRARDAALGLVQRRLYRQFAQGGSVSDVVANSILSKEIQDLQADLNEIVSSQPTDNELNYAPPLKTTTKKRTTIRNVTGTAKRRSNPAIKDELISKGAETAGKTKKTFKELIEDAKNKLNNVKC